MARSKSALKRAIDSVPEGHDVGVWAVRLCRAVEAEVRKQDDAIILQMVEALKYHRAQTRPIELTDEAITAARKQGEKQ